MTGNQTMFMLTFVNNILTQFTNHFLFLILIQKSMFIYLCLSTTKTGQIFPETFVLPSTQLDITIIILKKTIFTIVFLFQF